LRDAVTELKSALTLSEQSRAAMYQAAQRDASAAVTAVVRAICPRLAELGLADAARDLITDSLEGSPRPIIVHAAPATASSLRESLGAEGLPGVEVLEQDGLSPLRLDVNWAGGSAEIDFDAVISRILEMAADLDASRSPNTESEAQ